jgi:cytochrome c553
MRAGVESGDMASTLKWMLHCGQQIHMQLFGSRARVVTLRQVVAIRHLAPVGSVRGAYNSRMNRFVSLRQRLRGHASCAAFVLGVWSLSASAAGLQTEAAPPVPDTMQQRVAACTGCHGVHGEGSPDSVVIPRLAGKPVGYLVQQLEYFQTGQRRHAPMEYVVRQLSSAYLRDIADYFAKQDVPYRKLPVLTVSVETLRRGEQLVMRGDSTRGVPSCVSCHGGKLTGVEPMMPGLMGLSYDYLSTQLVSWRTRQRAAEGPYCMGVVANRMRESDITAVSAWLASQEPPADLHPEPASAQTEPLPGWCVMGKSGAGP